MSKYLLKTLRYDPHKDKKPYYRIYELEDDGQSSILDCLNRIRWNIDSTLSFRRSCRSGICGSCAMNINGKNMLACETQLRDLKKKKICIKPLPFFEIIKDLVVDMETFFNGIKAIKPYIISERRQHAGQSAEERKRLDGLYECILCGSCTSSCPSFWYNEHYLGPAALLKAHRYNSDSRDFGKKARCRLIDDSDGVWQCRTIFNCVEACPKDLNPTESIQQLKKEIVKDTLL